MPSEGLSHLSVSWDVTIKAAGAAQQGGEHPSVLAQLMVLQPQRQREDAVPSQRWHRGTCRHMGCSSLCFPSPSQLLPEQSDCHALC